MALWSSLERPVTVIRLPPSAGFAEKGALQRPHVSQIPKSPMQGAVIPPCQRGRRQSDGRAPDCHPGLSCQFGKASTERVRYLEWQHHLFGPRRTTPAPAAPPPLTKGEFLAAAPLLGRYSSQSACPNVYFRNLDPYFGYLFQVFERALALEVLLLVPESREGGP